MSPALPLASDLLHVAQRCVWHKPPEQTLTNVPYFVAYVLTYGTHEDVKCLRRYVTDKDLGQMLDQAPPGIFDGRSWAYWHVMLDLPSQPMPQRHFPN